MLTKYLALVSESANVNFSLVSQISSALQKQITRDFTPVWQIPATIDCYATLEDIPSDYWPIIIKDDIGFDAAGIHLDRNGQPFALVRASGLVSLTCSHETLEMLADPFGNRFVASQSLKSGQGRVNFLVEICDPSEAEQFAYQINGIVVSDFYSPQYFDPVSNPAVRYSYTGAIKKPREVLPGGYISWTIPETGEWWQATFFNNHFDFRSLGVLSKQSSKSWRETIDEITKEPVKKQAKEDALADLPTSLALLSLSVKEASNGRARQLREDINSVIVKSNKD